MRIELEEMSEDGLTRDVWVFLADVSMFTSSDLIIKLDRWQHEMRATKRHKWARTIEGYARGHNRHSAYSGMQAPAASVPTPIAMEERIFAAIRARTVFIGPVDPKEPK